MTEDKNKEQELGVRVLENCRNQLYRSWPYLDGAFAGVGYAADPETGSIATDGEYFFFRPEFLLRAYAKEPEQVRRGYLHMLLHCLYLHLFPGEDVHPRFWNLACDMAVECILEKELPMPGNVVKRECLNLLRGQALSAETLYAGIRRGDFPWQTEELEAAFAFDDHSLWYRKRGAKEGTRRKWEKVMAYTAQSREKQKRRAGTASGNREETLDELYRSRYDYRKFLKRFARPGEEMELDMTAFDYIYYTYGMETYGDIPLIEPLEYREVNRLEELAIAIDTSGSCSRELVRKFLSETCEILSTRENFFEKMKVYLIQCDCCIQSAAVIHSVEEWETYSREIQIQGRGGTDFRPVFRYLDELKRGGELKHLKALIYFTDGDGIYPSARPDYETAFVFVKRTQSVKFVPPWALRLLTTA